MTEEPVDLGVDLSSESGPLCEHAIIIDARGADGPVLIGPPSSPESVKRLMEGIINGTVTRGGMAEAGWRDLGLLAEDGLKLKEPGGS